MTIDSHYRHYQYLWCPEIHEELSVCLTSQNQKLEPCWIFQIQQVPVTTTSKFGVFSSFIHRALLESEKPRTAAMLLSSGEAKSGFPANYIRKHSCIFLERANADDSSDDASLGTSLSSLALLGVLA